MSTMTISVPSRQPFTSLNGTRLKNLINRKNVQNALPTTMASPLKRHAPNDFDDVDTENIDPLKFSTPSKKPKSFDFKLTNSDNTPLFTLTPFQPPAQYVERQAAGQKRKAEDTPSANTGSLKHQRIAPSSAPTPAGRSPKGKKIGILSRRRMTSSPFTRINPPTFSAGESQPFSIDAALAGTVPLKSRSTHRRKGWNFVIHEDTPDDEMANLMEHSTCTLDISDDESRTSPKGDKDNKENIPPIDGPAAMLSSTTQVPATRRDMMTDEPRNPLGDLVTENFYAEGCDASSVILVPAEDATDNVVGNTATVCNIQEACSPSRSRANAMAEGRECWKDIIAQMAANTAATDAEQGPSNEDTAAIQIWESESAKGDDDAESQDPQANTTTTESVLA